MTLTFADAYYEIEEIARKLFESEGSKYASAEELGLDKRCGYKNLRVSQEFIATPLNNKKYLDYYGGFEYVDEAYTYVLGDYVFYMADDERVAGHLSRLEL